MTHTPTSTAKTHVCAQPRDVWMITRSVPVRDSEGMFVIITTDLVVDAPAGDVLLPIGKANSHATGTAWSPVREALMVVAMLDPHQQAPSYEPVRGCTKIGTAGPPST